jgi:hypothetical protein
MDRCSILFGWIFRHYLVITLLHGPDKTAAARKWMHLNSNVLKLQLVKVVIFTDKYGYGVPEGLSLRCFVFPNTDGKVKVFLVAMPSTP